MAVFLAIVVLVLGFFLYRFWKNRQTRKRLLETPLSDHQRKVVLEQVPLLRRLPTNLRQNLEGRINLFLHQIDFIGCDGLDVTEEMRLSIAAQACLLVVNSSTWYKNLRTILVYPGAFKSWQKDHEGYVVTERETVRLGESWARGPVVLSWAHSEEGALNDEDGHNVVLHEFAHQIDDLSGHADGAPLLSKGQTFAEWERVFVEAFERHIRNVERGHKTVLDAYGAEGPEELFAVSVEVFFEKPADLIREEPGIYAQLAELFQLDPLNWK